MSKTYIGISRDHSGSMRSLSHSALKDYNQTIGAIQEQASQKKQDTIVSTVICGLVGTRVDREVVNSNVHTLKPLTRYQTGGMTPLFDSVGELIEIFEKTPDAKKKDVAFLIMVITDGAENASSYWKTKLKAKIEELQRTDRWSFVFRVPRGYASNLAALGIPAGNIVEWDQTEEGLAESSYQTMSGIDTYYASRAIGETYTREFYTTDLSKTTVAEVKQNLVDISKEVKIVEVDTRHHDFSISRFVPTVFNHPMVKGHAFYQLTKPEKEIQDHKQIIIREIKTGKVYAGHPARQMLGFPQYGTIKVVPGDHGKFEIFVQSTSMNRKVKQGALLLYWERCV